ncbi:MAG: hypothetical protein WCF94_02475 [bacterium]
MSNGTVVDLEKEPIENQYYNVYKQALRDFLPYSKMVLLAKHLGRQVNIYDMKALVRSDGPEVVCHVCGKSFCPVVFAWLTDDNIHQITQDEKGFINTSMIPTFGQFSIAWVSKKPLIAAGCGTQFMKNSCLRRLTDQNIGGRCGEVSHPKSSVQIQEMFEKLSKKKR